MKPLEAVFFNAITAATAAYIFSHDAHNNIGGPSFFGDHEFFGDVYEAFVEARDKLIESASGNGFIFDRNEVQAAANDALKQFPPTQDATALFEGQQKIEVEFRVTLDALVSVDGSPTDVQNLAAGLSEDSLRVRSYKIGRRLTA